MPCAVVLREMVHREARTRTLRKAADPDVLNEPKRLKSVLPPLYSLLGKSLSSEAD